MNIRILIVDDHDVVRQGTRAILQRARPEWEICGEAATGREAIQAVRSGQPNVVILDISMPDMTGIEATPVIAKLAPNCRILFFTMHESNALLAEAQQLGAHGYVQKSQAGRDLVTAVDRLVHGGTFFYSYGGSGAPSSGEKDGPDSNGISSRTAVSDEARPSENAVVRWSFRRNFVLSGKDLPVVKSPSFFPKRSMLLLAKYLAPVQSGCRRASNQGAFDLDILDISHVLRGAKCERFAC